VESNCRSITHKFKLFGGKAYRNNTLYSKEISSQLLLNGNPISRVNYRYAEFERNCRSITFIQLLIVASNPRLIVRIIEKNGFERHCRPGAFVVLIVVLRSPENYSVNLYIWMPDHFQRINYC
jgi:hypothetical protein